MNSVLLWGWFGFENLGDDLLLNTMISNLASEGRIITVPMSNQYYIKDDRVKQIKRSYKELFREVIHNEVLIIGPGGLFPFDNSKKVLVYFFAVLLWKIFGRKVIFFGIGISNRMGSFSRSLWKIIASISDLFLLRSSGVIEELGIKETDKIHTMADAVFASNLTFSKSLCEERVGIFVANLQQARTEKAYESSVRTWEKVVSGLLNRGFAVDLLAFTKGTDDKLICDIADAFRKEEMVRTIQYENVLDSVAKLKRYKITVSMRFHAMVLSLMAGVPTVPIAYGHKTCSLAKRSGLSEYLLIWNNFQKEYYGDTRDMSPEELLQKIDLIRLNYEESREKILDVTEELKASSKSAMNQVIELVNQDRKMRDERR